MSLFPDSVRREVERRSFRAMMPCRLRPRLTARRGSRALGTKTMPDLCNATPLARVLLARAPGKASSVLGSARAIVCFHQNGEKKHSMTHAPRTGPKHSPQWKRLSCDNEGSIFLVLPSWSPVVEVHQPARDYINCTGRFVCSHGRVRTWDETRDGATAQHLEPKPQSALACLATKGRRERERRRRGQPMAGSGC
jgi:hypothetical protein